MKRSTVVAAVVLAILVGIVYWLERDDGSGADVERVFDVTEDDIERVEIRRFENEPVVIERKDESFRVVQPVDAASDPREVDLILSNLATMTVVRSLARENDMDMPNRAEFGLDTPTLEVRFVTNEGVEYGLRFGKDTLTPLNQYAERIGSDEVLVVATHVLNNLDKNAWDVRDKAIFHLPEDAEPERVSILRGDETIELANDGGVWKTVGPTRARVDRFTVTGMVARFRRAEMLELAEDTEGTGLDPPRYRLDVTFRGGTDRMALEIGSKKNIDYYARVSSHDPVFVIEGGLVDELRLKDARDLWSKKLLHHPTTETTVVRIVSSGSDRTLNRDEAQDLLSALSSATPIEIEIVTTLPSGDPAFVITVSTDGAEDEISIRLDEGVAYATRKDEDVRLRLPSEAWRDIEAELLSEAH